MSDNAVGGDWREALGAGRFDEAYRHYLISRQERAEPEGSEDLRSLSALADILDLVRERSWARAKRKLDRLEEPAPLLDWAALRLEIERLEQSSELLEQGEAEGALEILLGQENRWLEAEAANQRGTAQIQLGEVEAAEREFVTAVDRDPRHYRALTNLGNARLESGRVEEAVACYQRALGVNDEFANAHHNLGVAHRRQGKIGQSVKHLRRAQRVQQRVERERARERIGQGGGQAGLKALRWAFFAIAALVLFAILRGRGFL